jgi:hypothetical protein
MKYSLLVPALAAAVALAGGPCRAGRLPVAGWAEPAGEARVTGRPATIRLVAQAALEASWEKIHPAPGARYSYCGPARGMATLRPGESCSVVLQVQIIARGRVTVDSAIRIRVRNVGLPVDEPARLFYSNEPESVAAPGVLYQAALAAGEGSRLFLHHQNRAARPLRFVAHVTNPGSAAVEVLISQGLGGPHLDAILAGHRAAARYLENYRDGAGLVARIPPHSARLLMDLEVARMETVSAIIDIRPLTGGPLVCQVRADDRIVLPPANNGLLMAAAVADHVYSPTHEQISGRYAVGGNWLFVDLGHTAVASIDGKRRLEGNYGVIYTAELELANPLPGEHVVVLAFSPRAGCSRGAFLVGGRLVEVGPGLPPQECRVATFRLRSGETRRVTVSMMPAGGSFYPVWLVARSDVAAAERLPDGDGQKR